MILIEGYAVVCEDDCIADANGNMPANLKNEAEWAFFQAGLDVCDVVVLGRKSHEVTPNPKGRKRLVMTRRVHQPELHGADCVFWNPDHESLEGALGLFAIPCRRIGVTGGQGVFDHFLTGPAAYDHFYLSRIAGVRLDNGVKVFSGCLSDEQTAESLLADAGYIAQKEMHLDAEARVVEWQKTKTSIENR